MSSCEQAARCSGSRVCSLAPLPSSALPHVGGASCCDTVQSANLCFACSRRRAAPISAKYGDESQVRWEQLGGSSSSAPSLHSRVVPTSCMPWIFTHAPLTFPLCSSLTSSAEVWGAGGHLGVCLPAMSSEGSRLGPPGGGPAVCETRQRMLHQPYANPVSFLPLPCLSPCLLAATWRTPSAAGTCELGAELAGWQPAAEAGAYVFRACTATCLAPPAFPVRRMSLIHLCLYCRCTAWLQVRPGGQEPLQQPAGGWQGILS